MCCPPVWQSKPSVTIQRVSPWGGKPSPCSKETHRTLESNIFPLPGGRVDSNSTIEPDFLVTYRGRAGVIEVDGPHHASPHRRASDLSREKRLRSAGIAHVDRIDVRETTTKAEVEALVDTFLLRLEERR